MYERMQPLLNALSSNLHEREEAVRLGLLAALAGESMFLLGPPGTGKSLIARRLQQAFTDARGFVYLMGRFSTPDEVFGPLSISQLRDNDRYERVTANYLPEADVVFLDEIWKASPPIQNALLTALNERKFRNGDTERSIPMKVFVGASNELPHPDDEAAPFWDRFLIRLVVSPIRSENEFKALIADSSDPYAEVVSPQQRLTDEEYETIARARTVVEIGPEVLALIAAIRAGLSEKGIYVSDRRWKKLAGLLRTSAALHGRERVDPIDCAIIQNVAWSTLEEQPVVNEVVARELAARSGGQYAANLLDQRFGELKEEYRQLRTERAVDDRARPVLYRDEYFRLMPETQPNPDELLLVWHGEITDLAEGAPEEIDLFIYDGAQQLIGSDRVNANRTGEWGVLLDEAPHQIETTTERVELERDRELSPDQQAALAARSSALLADIRAQLEQSVSDQADLADEAHTHLFVPAADAGVVIESLRATATSLGRLELRVEHFLQEFTQAGE